MGLGGTASAAECGKSRKPDAPYSLPDSGRPGGPDPPAPLERARRHMARSLRRQAGGRQVEGLCRPQVQAWRALRTPEKLLDAGEVFLQGLRRRVPHLQERDLDPARLELGHQRRHEDPRRLREGLPAIGGLERMDGATGAADGS